MLLYFIYYAPCFIFAAAFATLITRRFLRHIDDVTPMLPISPSDFRRHWDILIRYQPPRV